MAGRPPKVKVKDIIADVDAYLAAADPPIVAEFAHRHNITREYLYQLAEKENEKGRPQLSYAIKRISEAKEIALEKGGLCGDYQANMAIFSLKQLGWRDKQDVNAGLTARELPKLYEALTGDDK